MADPQTSQNPETLPPDFFSKPVTVNPEQYRSGATPNPDTLPADFFSGGGKPQQPAGPKSILDRVVDSVAEFAKGANQTANPFTHESLQGNANLVAHPLHTGQSMLEAQGHLAEAAKDSFKQGNYIDGIRHAVAYMLPLVGPAIDKAGNDAGNGEVAKGLGEAAGIALPAVAPELLKNVEIPVTPKVPSSLNPVEQAAVQFGADKGIPMPAATQTGNKFVKGAQAIAQNQPLGAPIAAQAVRRTEGALTRVAGDLADAAHPTPVSAESAGQSVTGSVERNIASQNAIADKAYGEFRDIVNHPNNTRQVQTGTSQVQQPTVLGPNGQPVSGGATTVPITEDIQLPVDMRDIKDALKPQYEDMQQWMEPAKRNSSAGFQAIKSIVDGPDYIAAEQAEKGLGGLKTLARVDNPELRNVSQGIGANAAKMLQDKIDNTVFMGDRGTEAMTALWKGRAATATKMEIADVAKQLRTEPVQTFNKLVWQNDTGIDFLRKVAAQAPQDMPKVGRAFVQQLFDTATQEGGFNRSQSILRDWQKLGPETKEILYRSPALRADLDKFFTLANKLSENPNPSGSAVVGYSMVPAGMMLHDPISGTAYLLGGAGMAKLLYSPSGVRLLTEGMKASPASAASAARIAQIVKIAGDDAKVIPFPKAADANTGSDHSDSDLAQVPAKRRPPLSSFEIR